MTAFPRAGRCIVPPFARVEALADLAPDERALRRYAARPADVLFVGRFAPGQGQHRVQRVVARCAALSGVPLRLRLVGERDPRHAAYERRLREECRELGLSGRVELLEEPGEAERKALYLTSRVFLCCSEHEGPFRPLLEACWLGLPVIAARAPAALEALGTHGLVLPPDADDDLLAVTLWRVLRDGLLRERLVETQRDTIRARLARDIGEAGAGAEPLGLDG